MEEIANRGHRTVDDLPAKVVSIITKLICDVWKLRIKLVFL